MEIADFSYLIASLRGKRSYLSLLIQVLKALKSRPNLKLKTTQTDRIDFNTIIAKKLLTDWFFSKTRSCRPTRMLCNSFLQILLK